MKAINYFILLLAISIYFSSCRPEEQEKHDLDATTKEYFEIRDNSTFTFTEVSDTNISIVYTSSNFVNNRSNPDIENSEFLFYDLTSPNQPTYTIRCQSGGTQFKDQIALLTKFNDSIVVGPIIFNLGGNFSAGQNSFDSAIYHPTYQINSTVYKDVIRATLFNNPKYYEVYFAKKIGLIARKEKNGKFYYVKSYNLK